MLALDSRLRPNDEECASKSIDGEVVIINLSNGTYYGMDELGGAIWEMLADRRSLGEVVAALVARYDVTKDSAERDVRRLADELLAESLVRVVSAVDGVPLPDVAASLAPSPSGLRLRYTEPTLTAYKDMVDLVALDPPMPGLADIVWSEADDNPPQKT